MSGGKAGESENENMGDRIGRHLEWNKPRFREQHLDGYRNAELKTEKSSARESAVLLSGEGVLETPV